MKCVVCACLLIVQLCSCRTPSVDGVPLAKATAADGASYSSPIIVTARSQSEGPGEEAAWLMKTFPGFRVGGTGKEGDDEIVYLPHRTEARDGRIFSVWTIQLSDGAIRTVFFDVTACFGKP